MSTKHKLMQHAVTRRDFVLSSAAAAAVPLVASSSRVIGADESAHDYDVIVIGAGFAGVTAARETANAGLSTVIMEARNRLGGRTFYSQFGDHEVELGGTWVHWTQPHVWSEINRYRLELLEEPGTSDPERMVYRTGGKPVTVDPDDIWDDLESACAKFCAPSEAIYPRPFEPFHAMQAVEKYDALSVRDRLDEIELSPDMRDIMDGFWATCSHNRNTAGGFTEMVRWYALAGNDFQRLNDSIARFKFKTGTIALINAMLEDAKPEVVLSTPVEKIAQNATGVVVTTDEGQTLSAQRVIVTAPINTLTHIDFTPALSEEKLIVSRARHAGFGIKFYVHVKQNLGSLFCVAPDVDPIGFMFTNYHGSDGTTMVAFGPHPDLLDINDHEQVQDAVSLFFPEAEITDSVGYQWTHDPFSLGTWCTLRPTHTSKYLAGLQRTEGRVYFCGGDIANGWRGFLDGAIESGLRIGRDVVRALA